MYINYIFGHPSSFTLAHTKDHNGLVPTIHPPRLPLLFWVCCCLLPTRYTPAIIDLPSPPPRYHCCNLQLTTLNVIPAYYAMNLPVLPWYHHQHIFTGGHDRQVPMKWESLTVKIGTFYSNPTM